MVDFCGWVVEEKEKKKDERARDSPARLELLVFYYQILA